MSGRSAPPSGERTKRAHFYVFLGALLLLSAVFLRMIGPYVLALFLGGLLALLSHPVYDRLRRHRAGPRTAAALTALMVVFLVVAPMAAFGYAAAKQGVAVGKHLSELKEFSPGRLTRSLERAGLSRALGEPDEVNARLRDAINAAGMSMTGVVLSFLKSVPQALLQLALTLIAFYFLLIDGAAFADFLLSRAAFERDVQDMLRRTFTDMARSTVLSGFAAAAAQAAVICAAFLSLGVPGAFLAGAGTFFLAWLPVLGSLPAAAAGVGWLYFQGEPVRLGFMLAFALAAGLADNLVRPLVLKGRSDLHPLVGLVAIVAAIDMFGVMGIFVGPLLAAVVISLLDIWPEIARRFGVEVTDGA